MSSSSAAATPLALVVENSKLRADILAEKVLNAQQQELCARYEKALREQEQSAKQLEARLAQAAQAEQQAAAANASAIEALNERAAALAARVAAAENHHSSAAHAAAQAAARDQLSAELDSMTALMGRLKHDLATRDDELKARATEIAALQAERADLAQRLHAHDELKGRHAELSEQAAELATLKRELTSRDSELEAKAGEISALQAERAELAQRMYGHDALKGEHEELLLTARSRDDQVQAQSEEITRLRSEYSRSAAESAAASSVIDELRQSLRAAELARDAAAQRTQAVEAALADRDGALEAVRSQLASSETNVSRLQNELAATAAQVADAQHRLHAEREAAERRFEALSADAERRVKDAYEHPSARLNEAIAASEVAAEEQRRLAAILEDHLAAESEVAVWYLHSGARSVPSKDVARALAALLEETRTRIDERAKLSSSEGGDRGSSADAAATASQQQGAEATETPAAQARATLTALLHPPQPEPQPVTSGYENIPTIAHANITQLQQQLAATQRALQAVRNEAAVYEHDLTELRWRCVTLGIPTATSDSSNAGTFGSNKTMRPPKHVPDHEPFGHGAALLAGAGAAQLPGNGFVMARPPAPSAGSSFGNSFSSSAAPRGHFPVSVPVTRGASPGSLLLNRPSSSAAVY